MLQRHSSRRASLYETFLKQRLSGATRYDRIAGYFQSSLLELAGESLAAIPRVRILCNTEVAAADVKTLRMARSNAPLRMSYSLAGLMDRYPDTGGSRAGGRTGEDGI